MMFKFKIGDKVTCQDGPGIVVGRSMVEGVDPNNHFHCQNFQWVRYYVETAPGCGISCNESDLEFAELTPIEPPPADDLDARAREWVEARQKNKCPMVIVDNTGRVSSFWIECCHGIKHGDATLYSIGSPEALAAVRAHLVAQEKGEVDGSKTADKNSA